LYFVFCEWGVKKRKLGFTTFPQDEKLSHRREEEEWIPLWCLDFKKQPQSFSSFKFLASTITTQKITSTTTFMQVNSDLLFISLPLSFMKEDILLMFGNWRWRVMELLLYLNTELLTIMDQLAILSMGWVGFFHSISVNFLF